MTAAEERRRLTVLKDILRTEIKLEDAKENVEILGRALGSLIEDMGEVNPLFKQLHNRIVYTGSYYDNLRVKNATEFDLNLVLVFPFKSTDFEILTNCSPPSFAKFHLIARIEELSSRNGWIEIKNALKLFNGDYLIPQNVRSWFQGIVDRVNLNPPRVRGVSRIEKSGSGPAITLHIRTQNGVKLDVDLVPVIEFKPPNWPNGARQHFNQYINEKDKYWFLVPKPAPDKLAGRRENIDQLWRLHFPGIEHQLLYNKGCAKPIIKLMKLLRDKQNWDALASYYLKTVVMWAVINDRLDWNECNMPTLFLKMLKQLAEYVRNRELPYLFYPSFNLLYKLQSNSCLANNIYGSLTKHIRKIENNPEEYYAIMR